jgi:phosphoribosylanthranilate isomerase
MKTLIRTRVKICGITSTSDAQTVCENGADAIGLVFYEKSPRNVSITNAAEICRCLPPFVSSVGLFLDASKEFVESVLADVALDLLQFHGSETVEYCDFFDRPYIKAIGMQGLRNEAAFAEIADQYTNAKGFLVDSHAAGKAGGTGKTFDWKNVPQNYKKPIILAGGLNPENIADAMQQLDVYGIDLSSGVESQPGIKDPQKIKQLMNEVYRVQCSKQC